MASDDVFPSLPAHIQERVESIRERNDDRRGPYQIIERPGLQIDEVSASEVRVLEGICEGLTNDAIARVCSISVETVKSHVQNMVRRCGCANRTQLAYRHGRGELVVVDFGRTLK